MPLRPQLHSKTLGMLTAQFVIAPLEEDVKLRVGIFATPLKSYNCTVRVSSSNPFPQADTVPDLRGIAIKLADFNQDFVLLNVPTLPFGKPSAFSRQGKKDVSAVNLEMRKSGYAKALLEMTPARLNPSCPFDQQYWSTSLFKYGPNRMCKYSLVPTSAHSSPIPKQMGESYLSEAIQSHLEQHPASFDFMAQFGDEQFTIKEVGEFLGFQFPLETPYVKLATLNIPQQNMSMVVSRKTNSFRPNHALPEHAALGDSSWPRLGVRNALAVVKQLSSKGKGELGDEKKTIV